MWLSFDPLDVWFFRDGRPFDAGDAHWAHSRFPPPPETMLGAVRARFLDAVFAATSHPDIDLPHYNRWLKNHNRQASDPVVTCAFKEGKRRFGAGAEKGEDLAIRGPFVVVPAGLDAASRLLVTIPRDLMAGAKEHELTRLGPLADSRLMGIDGALWNSASGQGASVATLLPRPLVAEASSGGASDPEDRDWLSVRALDGYLRNARMEDLKDRINQPTKTETRTGIALDHNRAVRQQHFYRADFLRPLMSDDGGSTRVLVEIKTDQALADVLQANPAEWIGFGGEGRLAHTRVVANDEPDVACLTSLLDQAGGLATDVMTRASGTGWVRAVLVQPGVFKNGWVPDGVNLTTGLLDVNGHEFTLRSAATNKPDALSGWDLAAGIPKPLRRVVPAGGVYYFEHTGASDREQAMRAFVARYHGTHGFVGEPARQAAGYGLSVVGVCEPVLDDVAPV